jgi:hypothetical protein
LVLDRSSFEIKSGEKQTKNSTSRALTIRFDQSRLDARPLDSKQTGSGTKRKRFRQ